MALSCMAVRVATGARVGVLGISRTPGRTPGTAAFHVQQTLNAKKKS